MAVRMLTQVYTAVAFFFIQFSLTWASVGDTSFVFQRCYADCLKRGCTMSDDDFADSLPWYMKLQKWTCPDECKYVCMWTSVDAFIKDKSPIPQFFGKWPFIRVFGIQEPASVLFSLLNLLSHLIMIVKFRKQVSSTSQMYYVWHFYFLVAVNAWVGSMIFHTRDLPKTEMLDYFSATLLVATQFYALVCRVVGTHRWFIMSTITAGCIALFTQHIHHLVYVRFDYGYNMKVMMAVGAVNSIGWFIWCALQWKHQPYIWKCAVTVLLVGACFLLELLDFPPKWYIFDAHSLWHAGTSPLAFIWWSYAIDDCLYLSNQTKVEETKEGGDNSKQNAEKKEKAE